MINKGNHEQEIIDYINQDNIFLIDSLTSDPKDFFSQSLHSKHCYILEYIIIQNALKILNALLEANYSNEIMNIKIGKAVSLLHVAFSDGNCKSIQMIISHSNKAHLTLDDDGNTELHKWLIYHSTCKQCLKTLSIKYYLMNDYLTKPNNEGHNPLEIAAMNENEQACSFLLKYFIFDFGHRDNNNETILHKVSRSNLIGIVDNITSKNILTIKNNNNESCFTLALEKKHYHLAEFFIDKGIHLALKDKQIADGLSSDIPQGLLKKIKAAKVESCQSKKVMKMNTHSGRGKEYFDTKYEQYTHQQLNLNGNKDNKAKVSFLIENNSNSNTNTNTSNSYSNSNATSYTLQAKERGAKYPISYNKATPAYFGTSNITNSHNNNKEKVSYINFNTSKKPFGTKMQSEKTLNDNELSLIIPSDKSAIVKHPKKRKHEAMDTNQYSTSQNTVSFATLFNFEDIRCFTIIPPSDLVINRNEVIHYGENCILYKGSYIGIDVSVKVFTIEKMTKDEIKYFNNEILLNLSLRHPHIVTCLGTCQMDNKEYCLVMEYLEQNSLKVLLDNKRIELPIKERLRLIYEIALGIYYLHSRNPIVYHRDLKSSNVLLNKHRIAKLCDFGISKIVNSISEIGTNVTSTPYWMAPEFIIDNKFNDKSDIYSFGILMWEILTRDTLPYKNRNEFDFIIANREVLQERPIISPALHLQHKDIVGLMCQCWDAEPDRRPTIAEAVKQIKLIYSNEL